MKRVLVTGATGFIGRHVVRALSQRGYEVHAVGRRASSSFADCVYSHRSDLLVPGVAAQLIRDVAPDGLIHLAWEVGQDGAWQSDANDRWQRATVDLVDAFAGPDRRAVLAGTCAEYRWDNSVCVEAATPITPLTRYGQAKDAARNGAQLIARREGLSLVWARIFFTFGPGESPARLVPSVVRTVLAGETAETTHGLQIRDYLYVGDLADALVTLLTSDVRGEINVASGQPTRLSWLATRAAELAGDSERLKLGARVARPDEPERILADVSRLGQEVGWQPRIGIEEGLARTVAWWRATEAGSEAGSDGPFPA